jgi:ribosomal protein S18 acetylase RimI-like enzyme
MNPTEQSVRVESLSLPYMEGALSVQNNFIGSGRKKLCGLVPLTLFPTPMHEFKSLFTTEEALSLSAVAIRESDNKVVGFVHMTDVSIKRDMIMRCLHTSCDGECYIELLNVLPEVRGQGIGTRLLQYCEERARERGAQKLTLGVVDKNPAKNLYERFGFVDRERSVLERLRSVLSIFCIVGIPHWGCGGSIMDKDLHQ